MGHAKRRLGSERADQIDNCGRHKIRQALHADGVGCIIARPVRPFVLSTRLAGRGRPLNNSPTALEGQYVVPRYKRYKRCAHVALSGQLIVDASNLTILVAYRPNVHRDPTEALFERNEIAASHVLSRQPRLGLVAAAATSIHPSISLFPPANRTRQFTTCLFVRPITYYVHRSWRAGFSSRVGPSNKHHIRTWTAGGDGWFDKLLTSSSLTLPLSI